MGAMKYIVAKDPRGNWTPIWTKDSVDGKLELLHYKYSQYRTFAPEVCQTPFLTKHVRFEINTRDVPDWLVVWVGMFLYACSCLYACMYAFMMCMCYFTFILSLRHSSPFYQCLFLYQGQKWERTPLDLRSIKYFIASKRLNLKPFSIDGIFWPHPQYIITSHLK